MRILPPSLNISETEGFTPQKDIFKRVEFGRGLTRVINTSEDPLIILLDSPWGTGKTTFLEMWAGELRKSGHSVVYFDAFAHDHIDNAFLAIAGEIISLSRNKKDMNRTKSEKFLGAAAKAGSVLLRSVAKIGVKAATLGAIDAADLAEELSNVSGDIADSASEASDRYVRNILDRQSSDKATFEGFRKALGELSADLICPENDDINVSKGRSHLIFILDELDRCRPPFALDILETIKHLFSVQNVHFVLSANLAQLESSVRFNYGSDINAQLYLQKFYNFAVSFPEPEYGPNTIKLYIEYLSQKFKFERSSGSDVGSIIEMIGYVSEARQLPLRTIERIFANISVSIVMTPQNLIKIAPIVAGLCVMKVCNPVLFHRAKLGLLTMLDVDEVLRFDKWPVHKRGSAEWVRRWWVYCLEKELPIIDNFDWDTISGSLFRYNVGERTELVPWTVRSVVEPLSLPA